jgi:DNA-binding transcriptional regulator YiaG
MNYTPRHMTGAEIRAWRLENGYTQPVLAERLHTAANTVARWEQDRMVPPEGLPLMLKALRFTHGNLCPCCQCHRRYRKEA